jgi:hypothetical protein
MPVPISHGSSVTLPVTGVPPASVPCQSGRSYSFFTSTFRPRCVSIM